MMLRLRGLKVASIWALLLMMSLDLIHILTMFTASLLNLSVYFINCHTNYRTIVLKAYILRLLILI